MYAYGNGYLLVQPFVCLNNMTTSRIAPMKLLKSKSIVICLVASVFSSACFHKDTANKINGAASDSSLIFKKLSNAKKLVTTEDFVPQSVIDKIEASDLDLDLDAIAKTNLFAIDADGLPFAIVESASTFKSTYSYGSKDGKYIYIAVDGDASENNSFLSSDQCGVIRVTIADNSQSCVDSEFYPAPVTNEMKSSIAKGDIKPIQQDESGNVYYLAKSISDPAKQPVIRTIQGELEATSISPDNTNIISMLVQSDGSLIYEYEDNDGNTGLKLYHQGSSNALLEHEASSSDKLFYGIDQGNTVIYGITSFDAGNDKIMFAKIHPTVPGAIFRKTLNVEKLRQGRENFTPRQIIMGDNGYVYGVFISAQRKKSEESYHYYDIYRIFPYQGNKIASIKLDTQYWWDAIHSQDINIQVGKGYLYFKDSQKHPQGLFGNREIITAVNLSSLAVTELLADTQWANRYDIHQWKLVGDTIHFSGFDNSDSTVVSGTINTLDVAAGKTEADYLVVNKISSASDGAVDVRDMEVIEPPQTLADSGNAPEVSKFHIHPENLFTASLDFNKKMNRQSAVDGIKVVNQSNDESVEFLDVWNNNSVHLVLDSDASNSTTDALEYATSYNVQIDGSSQDNWSRTLSSGTGALAEQFETITSTGWHKGQSDIADGFANSSVGISKATDTSAFVDHILDDALSVAKNYLISFSVRSNNSGDELEFSFRKSDDTNFSTSLIRYDGYTRLLNNEVDSNLSFPVAFKGLWVKHTISLIDGDMLWEYEVNGEEGKTIAGNHTNMFATLGLSQVDIYKFLLSTKATSIALDNIEILEVDASGNTIGSAIFSENFDGDSLNQVFQ